LTVDRIDKFLRARLLQKESGDEKKKVYEILVDRLVLKTMTNKSPKAQILGVEAAFQTR